MHEDLKPPSGPRCVGIDLSCLMSQPWTGIGHYTAQLMRALFDTHRDGLRFKIFAALPA